MASNTQYSDAPPAYDAATNSQSQSAGAAPQQPQQQAQQQQQPRRSDSLPARDEDRDIENEHRILPPGWVVQFDNDHERFYFVDTLAPRGPRSIWTHPLDDPEWLSTVPRGMSPEQYVDKLWQDQPEPTPEPQPKTVQQQIQSEMGPDAQPGASSSSSHVSHAGQGRQSNNHPQSLQDIPGRTTTVNGRTVKQVAMSDLVEYELGKMGTPEEYERKNPPGGLSKMVHRKESARQRQRRHAEHRAQNLAEQLSYRAPMMNPYQSAYNYPAYGRPYGPAYGGMPMGAGYGYPYGRRPMGGGMGLPLGLGLAGGALLGGAMF